MNVLIAVDSRHGATAEIAETIALQLLTHGARATVEDAANVTGVGGYDGVVIGSAIYTGRWLKDAKKLAAREKDHLQGRPVWLFSSGPIGDPLFPEEPPLEIGALRELTGAREHRLFAGKLDRSELGVLEKAMITAVHAQEGDYRDWLEVRQFADEIADTLLSPVASG
ncbi:MAG: flavodoxin domain-containing protein [Dehalococcoidia bacterium]